MSAVTEAAAFVAREAGREDEHAERIAIAADYLIAAAQTEQAAVEGRIRRRLLPQINRARGGQ